MTEFLKQLSAHEKLVDTYISGVALSGDGEPTTTEQLILQRSAWVREWCGEHGMAMAEAAIRARYMAAETATTLRQLAETVASDMRESLLGLAERWSELREELTAACDVPAVGTAPAVGRLRQPVASRIGVATGHETRWAQMDVAPGIEDVYELYGLPGSLPDGDPGPEPVLAMAASGEVSLAGIDDAA